VTGLDGVRDAPRVTRGFPLRAGDVFDRVALEARRLLACTPLSVAEVGRHLGFPEPTNFGRFFHREVGRSPGQFRSEAAPDGLSRIPVQRRPPD